MRREMEKELKDAEDAEDAGSQAPATAGDKTRSFRRPSLTASVGNLGKLSDSQVDAERILEWKPDRLSNNFLAAREEERRRPGGQAWKASQKSEGEAVKRLLEKVLGIGPRRVLAHTAASASREQAARKYVVQAGHESLALSRAAQNVLREHGNFVHLPPRHGMLPASVQPYYWGTLPGRDVRAIEERHH